MTEAAFDLKAVLAGMVAYGVSVLLATALVFVTFRINARLVAIQDEEGLLKEGHRSAAVVLGAILLAQAILMRHAVFPVMVLVRETLLGRPDARDILLLAGRSALFVVVVAALSAGSVHIASWLFSRLTGKLDEHSEIGRDNVAVAIFCAFALLAVTLVLNEGMEDLVRSLIPYGSRGVVRIE